MGNLQGNELLNKFVETRKQKIFKDSSDYETLAEFIEEKSIVAVRKRGDYKEKKKQIRAIMNKYPKLKAFIEDEEIEELDIEELKKLREIAIIQIEIQNIKNEEIFKLGIQSSMIW